MLDGFGRGPTELMDEPPHETAGGTTKAAGRAAPERPTGRTAAAGTRGAAAPRMVTTGGKSPLSKQIAIIDWLNFTFDHDFDLYEVAETFTELLGLPCGADPVTARHGFTSALRLKAYYEGQLIPFGMLMWGGESQRNRAMISIEGGGCAVIRDWNLLTEWIKTLTNPRLTRVDLAVDLHNGEYDLDDAKTWALEGRFNNGGHHPELDTQGDWLTQRNGRTLYVGLARNGKMLRVYEKGKQLGDLQSEWVRFEVQYGSRDRVLPLDILTERDKYFAGAYPALQEIIDVTGEKIKTTTVTAMVTLSHLFKHLKSSYGKVIDVFARSGVDYTDLIDAIRISAVPKRLNLASVVDADMTAVARAVIYEGAEP